MSETLIPIPGRLHSVASEGVVTGANEIYDDTQGKLQSAINAEVDEALGTGGSVDEKIATAKSEVIGDATTDGNTLGKAEDRIESLEDAVGTGGSIDTRISDAINALDADETSTSSDGHVSIQVTEVNGVVSAVNVTTSDIPSATDTYTKSEVNAAIDADVLVETTRAQAAESSLSSSKADKATTLAGYGITDAYTKSETYNKTEVNGLVDTPHQEYVTVATYAELPETGSTDTIYRISNYDGSQVAAGVYSEYAWNGTEYIFLCVKSSVGEVFDISEYNNSATYADLTAALGTNGVNVPESLRKGGMSVKYVQSSDNKYVSYRLMADSFSTNVSDWQGVDDVPTVYSENLVKSGGVFNRLIKLKCFAVNMNDAMLKGAAIGDIYYNTTNKKLFILKQGGTASVIPYQDGAIYTYDNSLYVYNGTELKGVLLRGSYSNPDSVTTPGLYAQENKGDGYGYGILLVNKTNNLITQFEINIGVSDTIPSITYRQSTDGGTTWGDKINWLSKTSVPYLSKKIMGFGTIGAGNTGVTAVGQFFVNTTTNKLYQCINYPMVSLGSDAIEIPFYDGVLYIYDNTIYVYNGTELIGIKMEGSYTNPNDVKSDGWYVIKDRGDGFASNALLVQKNGNTIVQLQFTIGVSVTQPSIQYRLSNDNGTTWGSWIDWVEQAYSPYTPKTKVIYKFLKALGDTPNGQYYYNVSTLKVYQNNNGSAVEIVAREQDRYLFEGKQYIYSESGLTPLEDDILTISGYHPTTSSFAEDGTYYVVGNNLLYVIQAGVNSVLIPWEKGRKYQFDGALYYYNGTRLVRYDNTGVTISNPSSARCISDSFIGKASSAARIAITDDGIAYVVYMCGSNSWYEANTKVVISEFPINRPEMAKNYVVAEYTDAEISGSSIGLPNVHLLQNGNVRVLFSNFRTSKALMCLYYKDFNVENKTFGSLNRVTYNGSPMTFEVLESIVGTELETSDGIHISGNLMNDFGVDGGGNAIKYFFINAGDGNPVVFSTIDDFETVQLVKVLPITDRQYESALCKLDDTFYIYYRASSGSWLMTTTDWNTFTTPFQFSTLNNRSDIYTDGQKVYLCGANAEIDDVNKFRRTNAHILVGTGATLDGYTEVQEIHDERGLVELNYLHLGNTHIIVCSSSPIMIDNSNFDARYRGKVGIYFIPIREATPSGLIR